jgi:hypothetical protein
MNNFQQIHNWQDDLSNLPLIRYNNDDVKKQKREYVVC